jgi:heparan-alpha-glucosaminide N-acetyltransferase
MNTAGKLVFNKSSRVLSIDVFRGLTILVMVFVNDVAGVKGLPWWTYHIPPGAQGLTYVDVVFPAFLFIVGMAIPLAIEKRKKEGDSLPRILYHIIVRSLSLVAIGLLIMNGRDMDPETTGISYPAWNVGMFLGVILLWNRYPQTEGKRNILYKVLKFIGLALLIFLLIIYRRVDQGEIMWIDKTNWSILGGIGWAYLSVCILFLVFRGKYQGLVISLVLLVFLNVATKAGWADFIRDVPRFLWPFGSGSLASITLAGLLLSLIFIRNNLANSLRLKITWGISMAIILFVAGWLLLPFGLAKIGSTPSYTLFSAGICVILFILMYWMVDIKGISEWAVLIKPAGSNPLLTYILPDIYYAILGLSHSGLIGDEGWPGVLRSVLFTLFILGISAIMTRMKIRLQL